MEANQKTILVYDDFSSDRPVLMGCLYVNVLKGGESYSFEYDKEWLKKTGLALILDPELMPYSGRQYPSGKNILGLFADASPDRWGRVLMNKCERILAEKEGRKPSKLYNSDYLLGAYDETRMGGLRFKSNSKGPFLSDDKETAAPPWATLRTLEEASRHFENDELDLTEKWLNQLIKPGSSLGGARPKATVADTKDQLWIAKFPSKNDENDTLVTNKRPLNSFDSAAFFASYHIRITKSQGEEFFFCTKMQLWQIPICELVGSYDSLCLTKAVSRRSCGLCGRRRPSRGLVF